MVNALQHQAQDLVNMPILGKLLQDPGMIQRMAAENPLIKQALEKNPALLDALSQQSLKNLVSASQSPAAMSQLLGDPRHCECLN